MRPGSRVRPATSITCASAGQPSPRRGPAAMMRSPSMTTAASGTGAAPVPSMSVAPVRTSVMALTLVELHATHPALELEVALPRHRRLGAGQHLAPHAAAVGEEIDHHGGERLGIGDVDEVRVGDLEVGAVRGARRAADIGMDN